MHTSLSSQLTTVAPCGPPQCSHASDHAEHFSPTSTPVSSHLSSIVHRSSSMLTIYLPSPNWLRPCDATTVDCNPRHDRRRVDSILPGFHHLWPVRLHTHTHTCTHMQHTHTYRYVVSRPLTSSAPRPSICGLVRDPAWWSCGSVPTILLHERCRDSFPTPPDGLALPPFPCEPQQQ
jgi:hypothetical protein